ncbi:MAG: hypothetical protein N2663_05535 [Chlorobi bacterium]|nr:hypothetical protein [Chlorobiota bacterium]
MDTIAQRIIARLHPSRFARDGDYRDHLFRLVEQGIGGFCIMDGMLEEVTDAIEQLRAAARHRLLFAIDAETGLGMRLDDTVEFPHAFALGLQQPDITDKVSAIIARSLRSLGIGWNFAPVADIHSNERNPIIGIRAFGSDPMRVVEHIRAWIAGHRREGIASCVKHFPGHGDANVDSHVELPVITASREQLVERELVPFFAAIKDGVPSVMVGHLSVPALDVTGEIASLSPAIVRGLLRERLGYDGIVVTDALDMKPIQQRLSSGEAVVRAFAAGADVALLPTDPHEAIVAVRGAFQSGTLSQDEHHAALERIERIATVNQLPANVSLSEMADLALQTARTAIRMVGDQTVLPLSQYAHIAALAVVNQDDDLEAPTEFFRYLAQLYRGNMDVGFITRDIDKTDIDDHADAMRDAECLIVAVFERPRAFRQPLGRSDALDAALARLSQEKRRVLVMAGSPHVAVKFPAEVVLWTFSDSSPSCAAAALTLVEHYE